MSKIRIGLISPYRGKDTEEHIENLQNARAWTIHQQIEGRIPVVPHIIFTEILDDADPRQREKGIRLGHELYLECAYCHVCTWGRGIISAGMKQDIEFCKANGIELRGEI